MQYFREMDEISCKLNSWKIFENGGMHVQLSYI